MIGSAVAAIISVGSGVMANSIGVGGLPGILSIKPAIYGECLQYAMVVAIVVPFVLTVILGKKELVIKYKLRKDGGDMPLLLLKLRSKIV